MRKATVGGHDIEIYESIEELPINRFHKYSKYLLIDSGIGSDLNDVNSHINRAIKYCASDSPLAITELENLQKSIYLVSEGISPKHLAFAALVAKIDGIVTDDLSDEGMRRVIEVLGETPKNWLDNVIELAKKKYRRRTQRILSKLV